MKYIIADIGINHNGSKSTIIKMIELVKLSGADAVKFQFWTDEYYNICPWKEELNGRNLSLPTLNYIKKYCSELKLDFFVTAFDQNSFDIVKTLDPPIYKIPSNAYVIINHLLIQDIIKSAIRNNKKLFVSTGGYNLNTLFDLYINKVPNLTLFHCVSEYPTLPHRADFKKLIKLISITGGSNIIDGIGLSDHSSKIELPIAAVALGAKAIEVHVTLNKNSIGPDHKASLTFEELTRMVEQIRNVEEALGE